MEGTLAHEAVFFCFCAVATAKCWFERRFSFHQSGDTTPFKMTGDTTTCRITGVTVHTELCLQNEGTSFVRDVEVWGQSLVKK